MLYYRGVWGWLSLRQKCAPLLWHVASSPDCRAEAAILTTITLGTFVWASRADPGAVTKENDKEYLY